MREIKPLQTVTDGEPCIFLSGSIEMGNAEIWQDKVVQLLSESNWTILNPRRDFWDSNLIQEIGNKHFFDQVYWELSGIERADRILVYFDPNGKAPITLFELGFIVGKMPDKLVVVCPKGFWRKGNVDIVCYLNNVKQYDNLIEACEYLKLLG